VRLSDGGSGPLVLKIPGLAGGVGLCHEEIDAARAAGFRVVGLDTSGDRADDPAPGRLSWDGLASEVFAALDRLGAERAVLWGTSFGCLICLAAAARRPERVTGLLLCAPPEPRWRPPAYLAILEHASARRNPARAATLWFRTGFVVLNAWEFINPLALLRVPRLARAAVEARTPSTTIHDKLELLFRDDPGLPPASVPCSIIAGAWDTITWPGASRRLARALPGSRLHRLRLTGHACAYARPRSHMRRAIEELRRLSATAN
jgi:pimeloyl-ACP methyl ester carboxylesterase